RSGRRALAGFGWVGGSSWLPGRMTCRALRIGARGLRSSWASTARNSSLRRSASLRASSARLVSSMSVQVPNQRTMRPCSSRTGTAQEPAVAARLAVLEAVLDLVGLLGLDAAEVGVHAALHVVGVQDRLPTRLAVL